LCDQANLRREHVLAVRYCLCTALDEAANNTTWGRRGIWAGKSLLVTFHGESEGGIKLFQIIGRLAASFQEHGNVLEVIYHLLGLGFEGRYSVQPDGRKQLDNIRQQLLTQLSQRRDPVMPALSPDFQGAISGRLRRMRRVPVWLSAGIALLAMLTLFGLYSHRMDVQTVTVQQHIDAIGIKLPPPPVPVHKLRL
ncbi:type IVB secretion system protein IcmH/DotU, partial [Salmonella enterica subsp. enterica serovar Kottbus]|nr:type IVB secretion system protein IcmH/DotU [Salmonella enterica subsp. enterica serovar Kottbus]